MGETATVLGLRQLADRGSVEGQSDDELIAGVRAGVPAAFEEIYDRYARGILAFCAHMLGSRDAAEDALQLTFVSAYRALRSGESSIALRPWLYTIARNRCLSELRARRDAIGVDELTTDQPVVDGITDQVQRREDLREMLDDMRRLPADQRAALVLFELGDHPQKDIASVLGVRTEKVKALVFQAREALVRGRQARQHPCGDIREQLATMAGQVPARSILRAHIDRCPGCQSFEYEVRDQRAALALIVPVALAGELKGLVLGSVLHGGGAVAAACGSGGGVLAAGGGGGAVAGSGSAAAAGACGGTAVVGGATAVGGASAIGAATAGSVGSGISAVSAATASGIAGAGAVATSAPVVVAATGLTALGESVGVGGLTASGVMAKILTAAAIATVAASAGHDPAHPLLRRPAAPPTLRQKLLASVPARPAARTVPVLAAKPVTVPVSAPGTATSTPFGTPGAAPSSTSTTSGGGTSTPTSGGSTSGTPGGPAQPTGTTPAGGSGAQPASAGSQPGASPTGTGTTPSAGSGAATTPTAGTSDPTASPTTGTASSPAAPATDPSTSAGDSSAPPADTTGSSSSAAAAPSTPATDSTAAGGGSADTGSASSGSNTDTSTQASSPDSTPATPAVDQTPPAASTQSSAAAQVNVSSTASAAAQGDATATTG